MAVYRCPKCGEIVRKDAKKCSTCGLWFDLEHEPWLDDGSGKPESMRKKEKKRVFIVIAGLAVFLAIIIAVIIVNTREVHDKVNYWNEKSKIGAVASG
jgi:uncharacterized membrane protein YvbJ